MRKFVQLKKQKKIRNIPDDSGGLYEVLLNEKTSFKYLCKTDLLSKTH